MYVQLVAIYQHERQELGGLKSLVFMGILEKYLTMKCLIGFCRRKICPNIYKMQKQNG